MEQQSILRRNWRSIYIFFTLLADLVIIVTSALSALVLDLIPMYPLRDRNLTCCD